MVLIEQWEQGGLSIKMFCDQHHFYYSLFHSWLNEYRRGKVKSDNKFVPLQITNLSTSTQNYSTLYVEAILKDGSHIKVYQQVQADFLRTLIV